MPNPTEMVKQVAKELKEKADAAGMDKVDGFVDELEAIKEKAKAGAGDILDKLKESLESFKTKIADALNDPASIAGGGGAMAACASWYGGAVCAQLKNLSSEVEELVKIMTSQATAVAGPMKEVGEVMGSAMTGLNNTVKGLSKLPKQVQDLADTVKGPDDVAKVDTKPMDKACDVSGLDGPLGALAGLKDKMGPVIDGIKAAAEKLASFITDAPDKIKNAFNIPQPLCFLQSVLMSNAPPLMKELMDKLELLKGIDLTPFVEKIGQMANTLTNINVDTVRDPVTNFGSEAKGKIANLEKAVQAAKLASNPAGALGSMGKMF